MGPGSAKQRFAKSYALHRARDTRIVIPGRAFFRREPGIQRCFALRALHIEIPGSPPSVRFADPLATPRNDGGFCSTPGTGVAHTALYPPSAITIEPVT